METDAGFLRQLSLKTTSYLFSPGKYITHSWRFDLFTSTFKKLTPILVFISGDFIVYAGDMGREMYCVRRGLVEVIGDDDYTVVATLGPGAYFGEVLDPLYVKL